MSSLINSIENDETGEAFPIHRPSDCIFVCDSCDEDGTDDHSCPYQADVRNNPNSMCNCCANCTNECAMDI